MEAIQEVEITIHSCGEEPFWTITDKATGAVLRQSDGWCGEEEDEVCESTTWRKLEAFCDKRGWRHTRAWS